MLKVTLYERVITMRSGAVYIQRKSAAVSPLLKNEG
jgi:hypothetical protein